ncbi:MAG: 30S ribosomal protein S16 [Patescibacteria group bacterium]|jgi:small subunit ribosomal protein S16
MLAIKLSRIGKKNQPHYRLIITEKGRDPFGEALEILGDYNPRTKALQVKEDRIKHWISKGAQMTPSVNNLLVEKKVIEGKKVKASKDPKNTEAAPEKAEEKKEAAKSEVKEEKTEAPQEVSGEIKEEAPDKASESSGEGPNE